MAVYVATNYNIKVNGTDLSNRIAAVTYDISVAEQEVTAFGDTFVQRIGGLKDASISIDWHQDFATSGGVDSVIFPLLGSNATVVVIPNGTAVSSSNPSFTGIFLVTEYSPLASSIGDLATFSTSWPLASGTVTRGTA